MACSEFYVTSLLTMLISMHISPVRLSDRVWRRLACRAHQLWRSIAGGAEPAAGEEGCALQPPHQIAADPQKRDNKQRHGGSGGQLEQAGAVSRDSAIRSIRTVWPPAVARWTDTWVASRATRRQAPPNTEQPARYRRFYITVRFGLQPGHQS